MNKPALKLSTDGSVWCKDKKTQFGYLYLGWFTNKFFWTETYRVLDIWPDYFTMKNRFSYHKGK